MRSKLIVAAALLALAAPVSASAHPTKATAIVRSLRRGVAWHRSMTWIYQDRAGVRRTLTVYAEKRTRSVAFLRWIDRLWSRRRIHARRFASRRLLASSAGGVAHEALWLCIHSGYLNGRRVSSGEGAWNANTGNGFFGGLQMTSPWGAGAYYVGRADLLSPGEQMRKAELGYVASGHSTSWLRGQWPNTSPPCLSLA